MEYVNFASVWIGLRPLKRGAGRDEDSQFHPLIAVCTHFINRRPWSHFPNIFNKLTTIPIPNGWDENKKFRPCFPQRFALA